MLRRNIILTTAALMAVFAVPASAQTYQDLRSPDAKDAAAQRGLYESESGPYVLSATTARPTRPTLPGTCRPRQSPRMPPLVSTRTRSARLSSRPRCSRCWPASATRSPPRGTCRPRQSPRMPPPASTRTRSARLSSRPRCSRCCPASTARSPRFRRSSRSARSSGGFDWGDAGIGAAGMLALFSIAAGSALLLMGAGAAAESVWRRTEPSRESTRDGHLNGGRRQRRRPPSAFSPGFDAAIAVGGGFRVLLGVYRRLPGPTLRCNRSARS